MSEANDVQAAATQPGRPASGSPELEPEASGEAGMDTDIEAAPMPWFGWIVNLVGWVYIVITCLLLGGPVVGLQAVLFPFGLANAWGDFTTWWWTGLLLRSWRVGFEVDGLENIKPGQTYVLCSNHRSHMDALACLHGLKGHLRFGFIMKRSLSLIPVFGWFIWMNGYIPIDRGSRKRGRDQLATGIKYLKKGRSVMMYPEGTRSPTHHFLPFKRGAVVLAIRAGVPLLPVVVSGTATVWPKPSLFVRPGRVRVEVLPPIETAGLSMEDRDEIVGRVRDGIVSRYRTRWDGPTLAETPALRQALEHRSIRDRPSELQSASPGS